MNSRYAHHKKCAKCKIASTTPHSKICGSCALKIAHQKKCTICGTSPVIFFSSGFVSEFCQEHVYCALEDTMERKSRLGERTKELDADLKKERIRSDSYRNRYYSYRDEVEDARLDGARKRMKESASDLSEYDIQEVNKYLY